MNGGEQQPAGGHMLGHEDPDQGAAVGVKGRQRLVQQPKRPGAAQQARQGEAPSLTGGEDPYLKVEKTPKTQAMGGRQGGVLVAAAPTRLEDQFVAHPTPRLQAVLMANEVTAESPGVVAGDRSLPPLKGDRSGGGSDKARHRPQ